MIRYRFCVQAQWLSNAIKHWYKERCSFNAPILLLYYIFCRICHFWHAMNKGFPCCVRTGSIIQFPTFSIRWVNRPDDQSFKNISKNEWKPLIIFMYTWLTDGVWNFSVIDNNHTFIKIFLYRISTKEISINKKQENVNNKLRPNYFHLYWVVRGAFIKYMPCLQNLKSLTNIPLQLIWCSKTFNCSLKGH